MHVAVRDTFERPEDRQLLDDYVQTRSEEAFAELVKRYSGIVYSAALRQLRDRHLAEDVTQGVFILLAQRAATLRDDIILAGWLYNSARFLAGNIIKKEARRRRHEPAAEASRMARVQSGETLAHEVLPLLDEAMEDLPDRDRDVLVLRYFERKTLAQVADALAISGDAAEKRVARGLDKLRGVLARRGVVATAIPLATLLSTEAVHAAPAALVHSMQTVGPSSALVGNAAGVAPSIAKSPLPTIPKALTGLAACLLIASTATTLIIKRVTATKPIIGVVAAPAMPPALPLRNGMNLQLVRIPAGGAIVKPFLMGKFEVTQAQWSAVMPSNPSRFRGNDRPVERVTWAEANTFCEKVSALTGMKVRLPTEQEWEHASRAGTTTRYYFGDDSATLSEHAWHGVQVPSADPATKPVQLGAFTTGGSGGSTHPVGTKLPNPWGLHDVYGNVWEWCDSIAPPSTATAEATSPTAPTGSMKVRRGGSWYNSMPQEFRSSYRWVSVEGLRQDNVGLRVVVEEQ